jgi:hypothetical protein
MIVRDFNKEDEARIFRDAKRQEKLAASIFTYGKDRYRVKVWELWPTRPEDTQWRLSDSATKLSDDIKELTKVKEIISSQKFVDCDYESILTVANKLEKEEWFKTPKDVLDFFDYPDKQLDKIKDMVDTALKEYDEEWNDKSEVSVEG